MVSKWNRKCEKRGDEVNLSAGCVLLLDDLPMVWPDCIQWGIIPCRAILPDLARDAHDSPQRVKLVWSSTEVKRAAFPVELCHRLGSMDVRKYKQQG